MLAGAEAGVPGALSVLAGVIVEGPPHLFLPLPLPSRAIRIQLLKPLNRPLHKSSREMESSMLILLIVLILVFGFGGYRMGPGLGYYGGGGLSLVLLIVLIVLLLR
jgi:hypothetical protein